ncbi:MAG: DUF2914 domain-containing protein [bacterium]
MRTLLLIIMLCAGIQAMPALAQNATGNPGSVENATFTSNVTDGAPVDYRDAFDTTTRVIYYYAEVLDLHGQTIKHRWKRDGKLMLEVPIPVQRQRQAVWSKSEMQPQWTGAWTVEVVNGRGEVIEVDNFAYNAPL